MTQITHSNLLVMARFGTLGVPLTHIRAHIRFQTVFLVLAFKICPFGPAIETFNNTQTQSFPLHTQSNHHFKHIHPPIIVLSGCYSSSKLFLNFPSRRFIPFSGLTFPLPSQFRFYPFKFSKSFLNIIALISIAEFHILITFLQFFLRFPLFSFFANYGFSNVLYG
jgi:hypothetical protein